MIVLSSATRGAPSARAARLSALCAKSGIALSRHVVRGCFLCKFYSLRAGLAPVFGGDMGRHEGIARAGDAPWRDFGGEGGVFLSQPAVAGRMATMGDDDAPRTRGQKRLGAVLRRLQALRAADERGFLEIDIERGPGVADDHAQAFSLARRGGGDAQVGAGEGGGGRDLRQQRFSEIAI